MSVQPARGRSVARFLRSHSGIASIQGPQGNSVCDLVVPSPYRIEVRASRGVQYLLTRFNGLLDDKSLWALVAHTKEHPVNEARVLMSLDNYAVLLGAHHTLSQDAYTDKEGR